MAQNTPAPILSLSELSKVNFYGSVAMVGGAFDIFHGDHIEQLYASSRLADFLVVHISSNERVKEKKGPSRPIFDEKQRAKVIAAIRYVDYVFIHSGRHYD